MDATMTAFCANCQNDTEHSVYVDDAGELVLTCSTENCGRFIKLPKGISEDEARAYFAAHKDSNLGQVSREKAEEEANRLIAALNGSAPEIPQPPAN
jgi:hypothetical protein